MSKDEFAQLCKDTNEHYIEKHGQSYEDYIEEKVVHETPKFSNLEDAIFFVLFQKKNDLVYGSLGATFDMDGSSAHLNYNRFNVLIEETLKKKKSSRHVVLRPWKNSRK